MAMISCRRRVEDVFNFPAIEVPMLVTTVALDILGVCAMTQCGVFAGQGWAQGLGFASVGTATLLAGGHLYNRSEGALGWNPLFFRALVLGGIALTVLGGVAVGHVGFFAQQNWSTALGATLLMVATPTTVAIVGRKALTRRFEVFPFETIVPAMTVALAILGSFAMTQTGIFTGQSWAPGFGYAAIGTATALALGHLLVRGQLDRERRSLFRGACAVLGIALTVIGGVAIGRVGLLAQQSWSAGFGITLLSVAVPTTAALVGKKALKGVLFRSFPVETLVIVTTVALAVLGIFAMTQNGLFAGQGWAPGLGYAAIGTATVLALGHILSRGYSIYGLNADILIGASIVLSTALAILGVMAMGRVGLFAHHGWSIGLGATLLATAVPLTISGFFRHNNFLPDALIIRPSNLVTIAKVAGVTALALLTIAALCLAQVGVLRACLKSF